ncbi:MAG TPA: hypothetical protein VGQ83_32515 [Polyangia bacterium]
MGLRVGLVAALWLLAAAPARGDHCTAARVGGAAALERADAAVRLDFIRARLRVEARRARVWSVAWAGTYATLAVGQIAPTPFLAPADRNGLYIGSGAALIGLIPLAVTPLKSMADQRWLERRLATAPPGTDVCALLAAAEGLFVRDAANEARGRSWVFHVGNVAFNTALFFAVGAGLGHWTSAVISGVAGIGIGELMIFTQPIGAVGALRRYRAGDLGAAPAPASAPRLGVGPILAGPRGLGAALRVAF